MTRGGQPVGEIVPLPVHDATRRGLFRRLARFLQSADRGFASFGAAHILPAPVVIAAIAIHDELVDPSVG